MEILSLSALHLVAKVHAFFTAKCPYSFQGILGFGSLGGGGAVGGLLYILHCILGFGRGGGGGQAGGGFLQSSEVSSVISQLR